MFLEDNFRFFVGWTGSWTGADMAGGKGVGELMSVRCVPCVLSVCFQQVS